MKSIRKALKILETLLENGEPLTISDISEYAGLNISTTYGIIAVLLEKGYLIQHSKRGKYSLGLKFLEYNEIVKKGLKINEVGLPYMEQLCHLTNESASMAILDKYVGMEIEIVQTDQLLMATGKTGGNMPLYCTALGKVLLAEMSDAELEDYFANVPLIAHTPNTITDLKTLKNQIAMVKQNGYAIDDQEVALGLRNIAAPVRYSNKNPVAVGIYGPTIRMTDQRMGELILAVKGCASEISKAMGCKQP